MKTPYWSEVIEQAKVVGAFTDEQQTLVGHFVTCACGKQDPRIPRLPNGTPVDGELDRLGMQFYFAVIENDTRLAEEVLGKIERRAAEVLAMVLG